jgi:hypothetical protein
LLLARSRSGDSYELVLGLLLVSLVLGISAPEEPWARVLRDAVLAATIVIAYWTATARRAFLIPRVIVPSIALTLVVVALAEGEQTRPVGALIEAALIAGTSFLVARDLFDRGRVDMQTVLGALSLYVLVGFFFGAVYAFVGRVDADPFFANGHDGTMSDYLYFSFVTISTTGFGDLSAAEEAGRALAVLEIVVGQLYLVTVVAVLVTAATGRALIQRRRD